MKLGQIDGKLSKLYQLPHISISRPWDASNSHFFQNFNLMKFKKFFANQTFLFGEVAQIFYICDGQAKRQFYRVR